jgi:argininosuccinate lyase
VLEHIRTRIGWVLGASDTVQTIVHGAPMGDTNDVEDPIMRPIVQAFEASGMVLELMTAVLETVRFNVDLLRERAGEGHTAVTAIAEALVSDGGIPFRAAHGVVSRLVQDSLDHGLPISPARIVAVTREETGTTIQMPEETLASLLDPWAFVEARSHPGGPATVATRAAVEAARAHLEQDRLDLDADAARITAARTARGAARALLMVSSNDEH